MGVGHSGESGEQLTDTVCGNQSSLRKGCDELCAGRLEMDIAVGGQDKVQTYSRSVGLGDDGLFASRKISSAALGIFASAGSGHSGTYF